MKNIFGYKINLSYWHIVDEKNNRNMYLMENYYENYI